MKPAAANTSLGTIAVAAAIITAVLGWNWQVTFRGEVLGFYRIGSQRPHSPFVTPPPHVLARGEVGYDGQMYLAIALDPALRHPGSRAALDNPRFRYRRILFPLLGHLVTFGHRPAIPYALIAINAVCYVAIVAIVARLLHAQSVAPWSALMVLASPGHWIALLFTTADLLAAVFLLLAITATVRRRAALFSFCYSLAALAHETMLLTAGILVLPWLAERRWRHVAIALAGATPPIAWNLFVLAHLPAHRSSLGVTESFGLPCAGIFAKFADIIASPVSAKWLFDAVAFAAISATFVLLVTAAVSQRPVSPPTLCALAYLGFFLLSRLHILGYHIDFLRVYANVVPMAVLARPHFPWPRLGSALLTVWGVLSAGFVTAFSLGLV
ncbi:MAG: hypothetical protein N2652_11170 [Kiritimatiellae bacterium]|nr:hypothetical protein [Kiritimatiellia bacterium]